MKLTPLDMRDDVNVEHAYFQLTLPCNDAYDALVVQFSGQSGFGCANNSDAVYMVAMVTAGLVAWEPLALILDLRELAYEWGDMMVAPLSAGSGHYAGGEDLPTAVVISDLNRVGLTSLVEMEMSAKTEDLLYDSLDAAVAAIDQKVSKSS